MFPVSHLDTAELDNQKIGVFDSDLLLPFLRETVFISPRWRFHLTVRVLFWIRNLRYGRLVGEVSGILIGKHGLSAPDARRIARATIAANPNETDSERLVAYALDIVNEKESPHDG